MGHCIESPSEVEINIHCSPLIHQASYLIIASYQFGQARFSLFKSMMTRFSHILVLHMFGISFQNYFLHQLSMERGKVDPLVGLYIILFFFLEDEGHLLSFSHQEPLQTSITFVISHETVEYSHRK